MSDIWDNKKAKQQKAAADRLRGSAYGKGDARRNENNEKFRLGMRLIELSDAGKRKTKEYDETLKAWRNA